MNGRFLLALALVAFGSGNSSQAEADELAEIVRVMKVREAATFPFWARLEITDKRRGGTYWSLGYEGWMYHSEDGVLLRRSTWEANSLTAGAFDKQAHTRVEKIDGVLSGANSLNLSRSSSAPNTEWSGSASPKRILRDGGPTLISSFGLFWGRERISTVIKRYESDVLDRVTWRNYNCVRVVVDMLRSPGQEAKTPPMPLLLWLSKDHGFYPVRAVFGTRVREPEDYEDAAATSGAFEYLGHRFVPSLDYQVDELVSVNGAWIPVKAHQPLLLPGSDAGTITCRVDEKSIRVGDIPPELYALTEVERAVVQDHSSGKRYVIGARGDGASPDNRKPAAGERTYTEYGLYPVSAPFVMRGWMYAVAAAVALGVGVVVRGRVLTARARERRDARGA